MPDEREEVIRQQMEETRTSLVEKLETLEHTVAETVTAATETVSNVKEAVQETVDSVKGSVQDTVESVKETFDVPAQIRRYPWLFFSGSMVLGYVGGRMLHRADWFRGAYTAPDARYYAAPAFETAVPRTNGFQQPAMGEPAEPRPVAAAPAKPRQKGWLESLTESYSSELAKLKGLAIGAALGLVRDSLVKSAPENLRSQVAEVMNTLTTKLGGEPIHGPVLDQPFLAQFRTSRPETAREEAARCHPQTVAASVGTTNWQD